MDKILNIDIGIKKALIAILLFLYAGTIIPIPYINNYFRMIHELGYGILNIGLVSLILAIILIYEISIRKV